MSVKNLLQRKSLQLMYLLLLCFATNSWAQNQYTVVPTGGTAGNTNGSGADPVCRYYNSIRYQVVYTAAELTASGMSAATSITALAWNVTESSVSLGNYTIKMGHTTATNAASHITTATTTVKNAFTYTVATGYNDIIFDNPFIWDGVSNVVVEICTGPSNTYTTPYGGVQAKTGVTNGSRSYRVDGSSACGTATGSTQTNKPYVRFTGTPPAACSGNPVAGMLTAPATVCASVPFTLSAPGATVAAGISYDWQYYDNTTSSWQATGGVGSSYTATAGISVPTDYRLVVTCANGGMQDISNVVSIGLNSWSNCYCTPSGASSSYGIKNFSTTGAQTNISNLASGYSTNGYGNFLNQVLTATTTVPVSFSADYIGSSFTYGFAIFIDYNHNGSFADAGEKVYNTTSYAASASGTFTIPVTAMTGTTRMRIVANYNNNTPSSDYCATGINGEFEDYTVDIVAIQACTGTPGATTITGPASVCSGSSFTLNATGVTVASGISTDWQFFDGSQWVSTGVSTSNYTVTSGITTATDYRLVTTCANSGDQSFSGTHSVTINPFYTCYCTPASNCTNEGITNVSLNTTLNNASAFCANTSGYSDYTSLGSATSLEQGVVYPMSVTANVNSNPASAGVWIDYNHNGVFEASEYTSLGSSTGITPLPSSYIFTADVTIPVNATTGLTRMRVRSANQGGITAASACTNSGVYGEYEDYFVTIVAGTSCNSTPVAGTVSAPAAVCPSNSFTLSATGATIAVGINYEWQSSLSGANSWTAISGASTTSYTVAAGITTPMDYRLVVTCTNGGTQDISNTVSVSLTPFANCYCVPGTTNSGSSDHIMNVTFAGINNTTGGSGTNGYNDYTTSVGAAIVMQGADYPFSMIIANGGTEYGGVWIDWNQNGFFDSFEFTSMGTGQTPTVLLQTISVPLSAVPGTTRMRVRSKYNAALAATEACGAYSYGETEDYLVTVITNTACSGTPNTAVASGPATAICAGAAFTLNASGLSTGVGISYSWEYFNGSNWVATGGTSASYTVANGVTSNTDYRLVTTCATGGTQSVSNSVSVGVQSVLVAPFTQSFDSSTFKNCWFTSGPENWLLSNGSGPGYGVAGSTEHTGNGGYFAWVDGSGTGTNQGIALNSPVIDIAALTNPQIRYFMKSFNSDDAARNKFRVLVLDNGNWITVDSVQMNLPNNGWHERIASLAGISSSLIQVRFVVDESNTGGSAFYNDILLDDVTVEGVVSCTGTPDIATASAPASVCAGQSFVLSATGASVGAGISYQWEASVAGTNSWAPIVGATTMNYTAASGITTALDFRLVTTCVNGGMQNISNTVSVSMSSWQQCYCAATASNTDELITDVSFAGFTNPNTGSGVSNYQDFTGLPPVTMAIGGQYPFSASIAPFYDNDVVAVWIDFNQDGVFDNATERVLMNAPAASPASGNINIPATAATGTTRMRIRLDYDNANPSPCGNNSYGNTEDYLVNLVSCPQATVNVAASATNICAGTTTTFTATAVDAGTTPVYQWTINGVAVTGATSSVFETTSLSNNDSVSVMVTADGTCASLPAAVSTAVVMTVNQPVLPTVSVAVAATTVCSGGAATFTAMATDAGAAPTYQWYMNGGAITGATADVYTATGINSGDMIYVALTSSQACISSATVISPTVIMSTFPAPAPVVANGATTICSSGGSVMLTADAGSGYLWSNGDTSQSITVMAANTYSVSYITANGCAATSSIDVFTKAMPGKIKIKNSGSSSVCEPEVVAFYIDLPAGSTTGFAYQWNLDGNPIPGATDSIYSTAVSGNISLTISGGSQCSKTSDPKAATVKPTPVASFTTTDTTTFCGGGSITLNADVMQGYSYKWFKDGVSAGSGTSKTFSASGFYTLEATLNGCKDTSAGLMVTVNAAPPMPKIKNLGSTTVCDGETVTFYLDPSVNSGGALFQWNLNGSPVAGATDSIYATPVSGDVSLTLTTGAGCTQTSSVKTATVKPRPVSSFTTNDPVTFCDGGSITLNADVVQGYSYKWLRDGSNAGSGTSKAFNTSGFYTLEATLNGCKDTSAGIAVTVNAAPPTPKIKNIGSTTVCDGAMVTFFLDPSVNSGGAMFQWNLNNSPIAGATDSIYSTGVSGDISLTLTTNAGCSKTSSVKTAVVKPNPVAGFSALGATTFCSGGSVTLEATPLANASYTWLRDGANAGSGASKSFKDAGSYTVVAKVDGCSDTAVGAVTITVNPLPSAVISSNDPITFCAGDSATLEAAPSGVGYSYDWMLGKTVVASTATPAYEAMTAGTYKVVVTDDNGCVSKASTSSIKVKINVMPEALIVPSGTVTIASNGTIKLKASPSGATYQWYLNGAPISGANAKDYVATTGGDYSVSVTKSGCEDLSDVTTVVQSTQREEAGITSTPDVAEALSFELVGYPNPVTNAVNISVKGIDEVNAMIHVMDINGRLITVKEMTQTTISIDMSNYASGMYLIRYKDATGRTGTLRITRQ